MWENFSAKVLNTFLILRFLLCILVFLVSLIIPFYIAVPMVIVWLYITRN